MKERYNMKKKIIISLLLVIAIVLISVTCGLHVTAYNNTSKTNTVFVIDENGKATVGVSYTGYKDITTHAQISVKIQKEGANTPVVNETIEASGVKYDGELERQLTEKGKYICTVVYTVYGSGGTPDVIEYSAERMCGKDASHATSAITKVPTPSPPSDPELMPFVDFGGYTFTFASCINATDGWADREVYAEENSTGVLDSAITDRNDIIFDNYNCHIKVVDIDSLTVTNGFMTNQENIDIIVGKYNIHTKGNGQYINFHELDIDLTDPWWDQRFIEDVTVDGQLYGAIGSFSVASFDATSAIFFNKTVKEQNEQLRNVDFYELVEKNEWTVDKFFEIAKKAYQSTDNGDIYGFMSVPNGIKDLYFGSGQRYSVKTDDENGVSSFTHGFNGDASAVTDKLIEMFGHESFRSDSAASVYSAFVNGGTLFTSELLRQASVYAADKKADGSAVDFGILPQPKLSSDQANYNHFIDNHMLYLSVPKTCANRAQIAYFLYLYAYHSYTTVYRKYLELFMYHYTNDTKSGEMVDLIINSRCYDLADQLYWGGVSGTYVNYVTKGINLISIPEEAALIGNAIEESAKSYKEYLHKNN